MNINLKSIYEETTLFLSEKAFPLISSQQKKIIAIVSLALGTLAIGYMITRYWIKSKVSNDTFQKELPGSSKDEQGLTRQKIIAIANDKFKDHLLKDKILEKISETLPNNEQLVTRVILDGRPTIPTPADYYEVCANVSDFFKELGIYGGTLENWVTKKPDK